MKKRIWFMVMGIVIVFGWFWPYWLKGKIPIAIDIPTGMYYPWLNYNYGYEVRPPVKNAILTDTVSQFWIWRNWAVEGVKEGKIRMWNPYSFSGYTMSPWFQTILLSPLNIYYWLTDQLGAMSLIVISQMVIGLIMGYWLGKEWFNNELSAIFLAVLWVTSSYFVGWLTWGTVSFGLALLPAGLVLIEKLKKKITGRVFLALIVTVTGLVFSGHLQTIGYVSIIWLIWAIIIGREVRERKKYWVMGVATVITVVGITAIAWWPSLGIIMDSSRMMDRQMMEINYGFANPIRVGLKLLSVNFFGNPGTNNYWGRGNNFQEELVNFGSLGMMMVIAYLLTKKREKLKNYEKLAIVSMTLGILLSIKYPLGFLIYWLKIPLVSTSPAARALVLMTFGGTILAATMFNKLVKGKVEAKKWLKFCLVIAGTFLGVGLGLMMAWLLLRYSADKGGLNLESSFNQVRIAIRNFGLSVVFVTAGIFFAWLMVLFRKWRKFAGIALILLLTGENYLFFKKYTPFVDKRLYFPKTKTTDFLTEQKKGDFFRIEREGAEILPPNMWQVYGLYSTSGYDPINPKNYSDYLTAMKIGPGYSRYIENGNKNIDNIADELGIRYWLVLKRNKAGIIDNEGTIAPWVDEQRWKEVYSEGPVAVLENRTFKGVIRWADSKDEGKLELTGRGETDWQIETDRTSKGKLVLAENEADGWEVKVDGKKTLLLKEDNIFKAVEVPAGKHKIEFYYESKDWKKAKTIGIISGILAWVWWQKNKKYLGQG